MPNWMQNTVRVVLICGTSAGMAWASEDCFLGKTPIRLDIGSETEGKTGMVQCRDSQTKQLVREREFKNGVPVYFRNYDDGRLMLEYGRDENGRNHGVLRRYNAKGQVLEEETQEHGQTLGFQRQWYESGAPKVVQYVQAGDAKSSAGGEASVRFTPKGQLSELHCAATALLAPHANDVLWCGHRGGAYTVDLFSDEDRLKARETWLNGQLIKGQRFGDDPKQVRSSLEIKDGLRTEVDYFDSGTKRLEQVWSVQGKDSIKVRLDEYYASGQHKLHQSFAQLQLAGRLRTLVQLEESYRQNGNLEERKRYTVQDDTLWLDAETFLQEGKLATKGRYEMRGNYRGQPVGVHQEFFASGKLQSESFYQKGRVVRLRSYDEKGLLLSDEQVFEDGSRRAFSR